MTLAAEPVQWSAGGLYLAPGLKDDWDSAVGAEVKVIFWQSETFGVAAAAGLQKWTPNDELTTSSETLDGGLGYGYAAQLDGDATMIPVGGSAIWRTKVGEKTTLTLEAGIRYVAVQSDVVLKYAEAIAGPDGVVGYEDEAENDIDDGIVGVIGADLHIPWTDIVGVFAGLGYQFDIAKGGQTIDGEDVGYDNELKAFIVRAGLTW